MNRSNWRTMKHRGSPAFTLVEILVSLVILALIVLMLGLIFNGSTSAIAQNNKLMDTLDVEQAVFQQLSLDISKMVLRDDVDYNFSKQSGSGGQGSNDILSFYAHTQGLDSAGPDGSTPPRPLSVVSYQIPTTGVPQLSYGALQIDWPPGSGTPSYALFVPSQISGATQPQSLTGGALPLPSATAYNQLAQEVIRFEYCFLLKSDPNANVPPNLLTAEPPSGTTAAPIENIMAIVVAIVVVDPKSRLLMGNGVDANVAKLFPDAKDNQDLLSLWNPIANNAALLESAGVPAQAVGGIHVYQKYFPLPW